MAIRNQGSVSWPVRAAVAAILGSAFILPAMSAEKADDKDKKEEGVSPVILLAAESDVASAVAGIRAGALDYIDKTQMERLLSLHLRRLILENGPGSGDHED